MHDEPKAHRDLQREAGPATRGDADVQLRVFPVFELVGGHEEITIRDAAYAYIAGARLEIPFLEAHRLRAIAASAALVEHQFAEACLQLPDHGLSLGLNGDAWGHVNSFKKKDPRGPEVLQLKIRNGPAQKKPSLFLL